MLTKITFTTWYYVWGGTKRQHRTGREGCTARSEEICPATRKTSQTKQGTKEMQAGTHNAVKRWLVVIVASIITVIRTFPFLTCGCYCCCCCCSCFFFFFPNNHKFLLSTSSQLVARGDTLSDLLDKPCLQVSSLLPPGTCPRFYRAYMGSSAFPRSHLPAC